MSIPDPILSPSEQEFRQRVRDMEAESARIRRALRVPARLQPKRVERAVMEVLSDE